MPELLFTEQKISFFSYSNHEGPLWLKDSQPLLASQGGASFSDPLLEVFCLPLPPTQSRLSFSHLFSYRHYWLAKNGDLVVGRIALFVRNSNNLSLFVPPGRRSHPLVDRKKTSSLCLSEENLDEPPPVEKVATRAFFGFFSLQMGYLSAGLQLLDIVHISAINNGFTLLDGPVSFHPFIGFGLLGPGTSDPPIFHQPHNETASHAIEHFFQHSPYKTSILHANIWEWQASYRIPPLAVKIARSTKVHDGLEFLPFDPEDQNHLEAIVNIHNDAYEKAPKFTPLTFLEVDWFLRTLGIVEPKCSTLILLDGEPIAALLTAENLKPLEWLHSDNMFGELPKRLYRSITRKKAPLRITMMAVRRAYRGSAVGSLSITLWHELVLRAAEAGYERLLTPPIDSNDAYHSHASQLLNLRKEREVRLFSSLF